MRLQLKLSVLTLLLFMLAACSTGVKKKNFPSNITNQEALMQTKDLHKQALDMQADLFAKESYEDGVEHLEEAQENIKDKGEMINNLSFASAYFEKAIKESTTNMASFNQIATTREELLKTDIRRYTKLNEKLREIDDDLISESDEFTDQVSVAETGAFQNKYLQLEVDTVKMIELGWANSIYKEATEKNFESLATRTHTKLKESLLLSSNLIERSPRNRDMYIDSVRRVNKDALLLDDVMAVMSRHEENTPERIAIDLVMKERALAKQNKRIQTYEDKVSAFRASLMEANSQMISRDFELEAKEEQIAYQKLLDNIRTSFDPEEAETFQKGNKVVIRLKSLDFAVGKAKIPERSESVLSKVSNIIARTDVEKVVIEGHTDSTGSEKINKALSEQRAMSVANFLESKGTLAPVVTVGRASNDPLANNDSRKSRALNRRVDIILDTKVPDIIYSE